MGEVILGAQPPQVRSCPETAPSIYEYELHRMKVLRAVARASPTDETSAQRDSLHHTFSKSKMNCPSSTVDFLVRLPRTDETSHHDTSMRLPFLYE